MAPYSLGNFSLSAVITSAAEAAALIASTSIFPATVLLKETIALPNITN